VVVQRWPILRRPCSVLGLILIAISVIAASFAEQVVHLLITQGVLYGIGGALLYTPFVICLGEWFVERKGLAFGLLWAGTGISGAIVPLIMNWGLSQYGFRTMLRAWGVAAVRIKLVQVAC
jgi:MFS family permease